MGDRNVLVYCTPRPLSPPALSYVVGKVRYVNADLAD